MIGRLRGRITPSDGETGVIVDVRGVGYDVTIVASELARARARARAEGDEVTLFIHTHVREDILELFGFESLLSRQVFRLLLGVPNVGPRIALGLLGDLPVPELASAVERGNVARLNKVSGVGKKTAERLVLELKEKLPRLAVGSVAGSPVGASPTPKDAQQLLGALTNLGYSDKDAKRAVAALGGRVGSESLSELLKAALRELA